MNEILIYADEGNCPISLKCLSAAFREENLHHRLRLVDRHFIIEESWENDTCVLVIPGGRDIPYHEALTGPGNKKISSYVKQGGRYLGICAGAYFAASSIEFEKGGPLEVTGTRELSFYPGIATGPAYGLNQFNYNSEVGARIAKLDVSGQKPLSAYYNGGCSFVDPHKYQNVSVVAKYSDIENAPAAIIQCQVGKGIAYLSGVHPEFSYAYLPASRKKQLPQLQDIESERKFLFQFILKNLNVI